MSDTTTIEIADWSRLPAKPLVSVYMLTYRHEKFIAQAIEGVVAQECEFPIELIIGEDCSPDQTRDIVLDYQRLYPGLIRVLTADRNVGAMANGRRCLLATRGKYIAICEGDDYWHHPRKLQMQVALMESNPAMPVCHTDYDRLTKRQHRRYCHRTHRSRWLAQGDAYVALLHEWSVKTATSMYRRNVLMAFIGSIYDNLSWPFGDRNKLLFASTRGPFGYIDESTATFRKTHGSATNSGVASSLELSLRTHDCMKLFLSHYPIDDMVARDVLSQINMTIYERAFKAKNKDAFMQSYRWLKCNGRSVARGGHMLRTIALRLGFPIDIMNIVRSFADRHLSAM